MVDAVSITSDTIDFILKHFGEMKEGNKPSRSLLPAGFSFGEKKINEEDMPDEKSRICFRCCWYVGREEKRLIYEVLSPWS